jgi:hypothetical protein
MGLCKGHSQIRWISQFVEGGKSQQREVEATMATDLYRRAFARAAQIIGGWESLAKTLEVDLQRINQWSARGARPPVHVLLSLAELLKQQWLRNYKLARPKRVNSGRSRPMTLHRAISKAISTRRKAHR